MPEEYSHSLCEPDIADWKELQEENRKGWQEFDGPLSVNECLTLRHRLLEQARNYTETLAADLSALSESDAFDGVSSGLERDALPEIVMTGHQPEIYTPGVAYKTVVLEKYLREYSGIGINVIIDLDEGAGGQFYFPQREEQSASKVLLQQGSLGVNAEIYSYQQVVSEEQVRLQFEVVRKELLALGLEKAAAGAEKAAGLYARFAGGSVVKANTVVRRMLQAGCSYYELPLSLILTFPETEKFLGSVFQDCKRFFEIYNANLKKYRVRNKIKNRANPFPNLEEVQGRFELPVWCVNLSQKLRHPLYLSREEGQVSFYAGRNKIACLAEELLPSYSKHLPQDYLLVPRAMLITAFLRLYASDLFIHGKGGAAYDQCTDDFIRTYYRIKPPRFVTASATQYLFEKRISEYQKLKWLEDNKRNLYFHVEKYLDQDFFSEENRERLKALVLRKQELVAAIVSGKRKQESTAAPTKGVKEVEQQIRTIVDRCLERYAEDALQESVKLKEIIFCRDFPFFFF